MIEMQYRERDYKITFSFLEIYNENLRDLILLNEQGNPPASVLDTSTVPPLEVRDDPVKGITVAGIK